MPENIVKRLRDLSERLVAESLVISAATMQEAADEIEYLRQRCEELDREKKLEDGIRRRKDGWG